MMEMIVKKKTYIFSNFTENIRKLATFGLKLPVSFLVVASLDIIIREFGNAISKAVEIMSIVIRQ